MKGKVIASCICICICVIAAVTLTLYLIRRGSERSDRSDRSDRSERFTESATCIYDKDGEVTSKNRVIMYYAPWCTQCTVFRPEFDKVAIQASDTKMDVCFLTVNSDTQPVGSTCLKDNGATIFPTIQLERGVGGPILYTGLRNANDLMAWVNKSLGV